MADEIKQLIDMVAKLKITVDEGFGLMNKKFEAIDKRFDDVDKRFDDVDKRFDDVDKRFDDVDKRFDDVDKRFDVMETAIKELNENSVKILNSIKLIERDVKNNKRHIERLEERESYL